MNVNYLGQKALYGDESIFLVGPTSMDKNIVSCMKVDCKLLKENIFME